MRGRARSRSGDVACILVVIAVSKVIGVDATMLQLSTLYTPTQKVGGFGEGGDAVSRPPVTSCRPCPRPGKQSDSQPDKDPPMSSPLSIATTAPRPLIRANPKTPKLVRLDVLEAATHVAGKACQLLIGLMLLVVIRGAPTVPLTRRTMARVNISREAAGPALRRLEDAGLVKVWRLPGRASMVCLLEPGKTTPLMIHPQDHR